MPIIEGVIQIWDQFVRNVHTIHKAVRFTLSLQTEICVWCTQTPSYMFALSHLPTLQTAFQAFVE